MGPKAESDFIRDWFVAWGMENASELQARAPPIRRFPARSHAFRARPRLQLCIRFAGGFSTRPALRHAAAPVVLGVLLFYTPHPPVRRNDISTFE